ncbi:intraflagellar transport 140 [Dorcoceras hygrometricum]|uniref:Intraflagellar transport 140 n=1 Tax=Dorcoceras hygrometricum TaxID=472368 RepID=A0A2Z7CT69_9LAMI|nr:intraflagellar transport 140 [Dorcoceras hygrometricum]
MVLSKDLEYTKAYVRCDSGYDGYHETHLIVAVYSEHVPSRLGRQNEDMLRGKTVILQFRPPPSSPHTPPPPPRVAGIRSGRFDEENPFVQNSSVLLVQADEGVSVLVVDRIGDYLPQSTEKSRVLVIPVGARHKCQQDSIGYPCIKASGESSTTKHRLLHASGPHPIPPPNDPK